MHAEQASMDMDISMDIHAKSVDVDMDMDEKFHIHGNPENYIERNYVSHELQIDAVCSSQYKCINSLSCLQTLK